MKILIQFEYRLKMFLLRFNGTLADVETVVQRNAPAFFKLGTVVGKGIGHFWETHHFLLKIFLLKGALLIEKIQGTIQKIKLLGTRHLVFVVVHILHKTLTHIHVILGKVVAVLARLKGQKILFPKTRLIALVDVVDRSEERRVGKECRSRWSP